MIGMCDVYMAQCKYCDAKIPMHLGDYKTERNEIFVVCDRCISKHTKELLKHRSVLWFYMDFPDMDYSRLFKMDMRLALIVSLTDNAWSNRDHNCPDTLISVPLLIYSPSEFLEETENIKALEKTIRNAIGEMKKIMKVVKSYLKHTYNAILSMKDDERYG